MKRNQLKRAGPYYGQEMTGHSWATRATAEVLKQQPDWFQPIPGHELVNALRGHRLSQGNAAYWGPDDGILNTAPPATTFDPNEPLYKWIIDDRRGDEKPEPLWMTKLASSKMNKNRKRKVKPKPKRPVNQGRHDEAPAKPNLASALAGDGRLERPAPKQTHRERGHFGYAGMGDQDKRLAARPKKKKPITNQGRHDG